ncbi:hypothetical protein DM01DRAFT_328640 [Hesseltinella vesiculosa]|uniref:Uncharacterized protein n=1 Tax=Hesseltinella vesiculosa TaxID=101127 RepID=A0A1X2GD96_9FUNG|nr:hypothetical protein DM01DRAFT_328640 [Hesseltinella vesiculosa]
MNKGAIFTFSSQNYDNLYFSLRITLSSLPPLLMPMETKLALSPHAPTTKRPRTIVYPTKTDISSIAENVPNQNWTTTANQPFVVALAITSAILIDEEKMLITTLEIYSHNTELDNHAEKATASRIQSSLPELNTRFKDLFVGTVNQAEGFFQCS